MRNTKIEWAQDSWTPIRATNGSQSGGERHGWHCEIITPGCENCYAQAINKRLGTQLPYLRKDRHAATLWLDENTLTQPLRWKKPRKIFVCSMTDLFGDWVRDEWIDRIFAVMALCPQHTFQVLTKRAKRMRDYFAADRRAKIYDAAETTSAVDSDHRSIGTGEWPLPNVWLGVSVEDQPRCDERIPLLRDTPAAVRWVSAEPLLGPVDAWPALHGLSGPKLDWIVIGGESGPGARPMHPDWARSIRDQCNAASVPFFFKQWGDLAPIGYPDGLSDKPEEHLWIRVGKKKAGRLLDGREWSEYPAQRPG